MYLTLIYHRLKFEVVVVIKTGALGYVNYDGYLFNKKIFILTNYLFNRRIFILFLTRYLLVEGYSFSLLQAIC